mmetsp:Transcript_26873/g.23784  ORF Transcript_26873/g.23784 Transcript_26873/m.23784 type:complete len:138 (+) Transcript_26873:76-489(+)
MDDPILWDNRRREDAIGIYNEIKRILEGIHFEKRDLSLPDAASSAGKGGRNFDDMMMDLGEEYDKRAGFSDPNIASLTQLGRQGQEGHAKDPTMYDSTRAPNPFKSSETGGKGPLRIFDNPNAQNVRNSARNQLPPN